MLLVFRKFQLINYSVLFWKLNPEVGALLSNWR